MTVWLYKATRSLVSPIDTRQLADEDGFLCRSAHRREVGTWVANVRNVKTGDTIHLYYVDPSLSRELGAYEVITPGEHAHPEWFGAAVHDSALYAVTDDAFIEARDPTSGYERDPTLRQFTGWLLRRTGPAMKYDAEQFRGLATLVQHRTG